MDLRVFEADHSPARTTLRERVNPAATKPDNVGLWRFYLAERSADMAALDPANFTPARFGLLLVDVPRKRNGTLLMGQLAVKTDWLDLQTGRLHENVSLLKFYNRVASKLRAKLLWQVEAENIVTKNAGVYPRIGYTLSAKAFAEEGGELMQEGVKNIRFYI